MPSSIAINDELVAYQGVGRGKPIVFIHGWLSTLRLWQNTVQHLSTKYRVYALDLWGFGNSGKNPHRYRFEQQVELVVNFLDIIGLPKAVLVGHDYGASLIARIAANPATAHRVHRFLAITPPLLDGAPSTPPILPPRLAEPSPAIKSLSKSLFQKWQSAEEDRPNQTTENPPKRGQIIQPALTLQTIFEAAPLEKLLAQHLDKNLAEFDKHRADLSQIDPQAIFKGIQDFNHVNTIHDLAEAEAPKVIFLGAKDTLLPTPSPETLDLLASVPDTRVMIGNEVGHYPMYDDKPLFLRLIRDFLETDNLDDLVFRAEYRSNL